MFFGQNHKFAVYKASLLVVFRKLYNILAVQIGDFVNEGMKKHAHFCCLFLNLIKNSKSIHGKAPALKVKAGLVSALRVLQDTNKADAFVRKLRGKIGFAFCKKAFFFCKK